MKKQLLTLLILSSIITGCATSQHIPATTITPGMADKIIEKGRTTQNELLSSLGSPNILTKNKTGNEVWTYDRMVVDSTQSAGHLTALVASFAGSRSSTSTRTFTLMIEFDANGIVRDYSYRASAF